MVQRVPVQRRKADTAPVNQAPAQSLLSGAPATPEVAARAETSSEERTGLEQPAVDTSAGLEIESSVEPKATHQFANLQVFASGEPLPPPLREKFQRSLGADLSDVRVHTDEDSSAAAQAFKSRAYTVDQDIHFAHGFFAPATTRGQRLLAHEVAHTVQQARSAGAPPGSEMRLSHRGYPAEMEATRAATAMVAGLSASVSGSGQSLGTVIQRDESGAEGSGPGNDGAGGSDGGVATVPNSTEYDPLADPEANTKPPVEPFDWFAAAAPVSEEVIGSWGGAPNYFVDYRHPAMRAGMQAFAQTWSDANSSWAAAAPLVVDYNYAAGAAGGDQDAATEGAVSEVSQSKVGESFAGDDLAFSSGIIDMKKLSKEKRIELKEAKDDLTKKTNAVETKWREVQKGLGTAQKGLNEGAKAIQSIKIKQIQMGIDIDESRKARVESEKAAAAGAIQSATKLTSAVAKAFVKPDDAIGDLIEGVGKAAETGASMAYDAEINSITSNIAIAKVKIGGIEADIEELNFKNAMIDADNAMKDVETAHVTYKEAVMDRKTGLAKFSLVLEKMAIASGASKQDAAKLQNAVEAVPLIEQAISLSGKVMAAIRIPPYTESSGLGAAVAENRSDFVAHLSVMKGYRESLALSQRKWANRLTAVNKFM